MSAVYYHGSGPLGSGPGAVRLPATTCPECERAWQQWHEGSWCPTKDAAEAAADAWLDRAEAENPESYR